ncbi:MAG: hypothetical protein Q4B06_02365 [Candidatus Saccharibacteria bacterium]|nr:hypothetical protein [Candidatus Saccharibacteria bacterium]
MSHTVANGTLFACVDVRGQLCDVYAMSPEGELQNYTPGAAVRHRIGVWIDGVYSWLDDADWQVRQTASQTSLSVHTTATNTVLGVQLAITTAVDCRDAIILREFHLTNLMQNARTVRLFLHQAFVLGDGKLTDDTVQLIPHHQAVVQYNGSTTFAVGARVDGGLFSEYAVGMFGTGHYEGTWRDAEDGRLDGGLAETGKVDSTLQLDCTLQPQGVAMMEYWLVQADSIAGALQLHSRMVATTVAKRLAATTVAWRRWLRPATARLAVCAPKQQTELLQSLLPIAARITTQGTVMTELSGLQRTAYCRPYHAAKALMPLVELGYTKEPLAFFTTCSRSLQTNGYLPAAITSDGSPGPGALLRTCEAPYAVDYVLGMAATIQLTYCYCLKHIRTAPLATLYKDLIAPLATALSRTAELDMCNPPATGYCVHSLDTIEARLLVRIALESATALAERLHDDAAAVAWRMAAEDIPQQPLCHDIAYDEADTHATIWKARQYISDGRLAEARALLDQLTNYLHTHGYIADRLIDGQPISVATQGEYAATLLALAQARRKR